LAPRYAEPMAQLVSIALGEKKPEAALSRLQKQIALAPGSGEMHMLLGEVHRVQGDLARAEGAYLRALELQPRLVAAHLKLGELYAQQGNNDQALARLEAALRVNPRDITALMASRGVYQRAHALLKESAAGLPENPVIQYHLGMAALKIGDRETARKSLAAAAESPKSFAGKQEAREALRQLQ